jgi:uncharacterized damage-inducible protein DinB
MQGSPFSDAFGHHVWASLRLIDTCLELTPEQLETSVPGTYGSILATMRHLVGGDSWYLFDITGDRARRVEEEAMDLRKLRSVMEADGGAWSDLLSKELDYEAILKEIDETDGYERDAPLGIRLAQALHHGTDHRSQICTALTALGIEPPSIDVWEYGVRAGRITEVPPNSQPDRSTGGQ